MARLLALWLGMASLLAGSAASAQTSTPTPTATPTATPTRVALSCTGARKLYVGWKAKDAFALRVFFTATGCETIYGCAGASSGNLVSQPPVSFQITDAQGRSFAKTITDPGTNVNGCPGQDTYQGLGRLRLIFGASTTLIGKQRVAQSQAVPPDLTPPIRIDLRDAGGALYTYHVGACYPRVSDSMVSYKCF